uniref:Uncharacterized protein n=1 Tax=Spongospora subterranea TaxID=70186 RepID=A0A0H5REZ6_9EUKA|eukprot:CRZ12618.1 hypothetical protein [Spongospora subterranea]
MFQHVHTVLQILRQHSLLANLSPFALHVSKIDFLGFRLSFRGSKTYICNFNLATSKFCQGTSFVLCVYSKTFTYHQPIFSLTKKDTIYQWNVSADVSFQNLKVSFCIGSYITPF